VDRKSVDVLVEELRQKNLINYYRNADIEKDAFNVDSISKLLENNFKLFLNEDDVLCYIDENGDQIIAPEIEGGITNTAEWLSDFLPGTTFDVSLGGNVRKVGYSI